MSLVGKFIQIVLWRCRVKAFLCSEFCSWWLWSVPTISNENKGSESVQWFSRFLIEISSSKGCYYGRSLIVPSRLMQFTRFSSGRFCRILTAHPGWLAQLTIWRSRLHLRLYVDRDLSGTVQGGTTTDNLWNRSIRLWPISQLQYHFLTHTEMHYYHFLSVCELFRKYPYRYSCTFHSNMSGSRSTSFLLFVFMVVVFMWYILIILTEISLNHWIQRLFTTWKARPFPLHRTDKCLFDASRTGI